MDRREFAKTLAGVSIGLAGDGLRGARAGETLPVRPLGHTGVAVTMLGAGGHHVGLSGSATAARRLVDAALDAGIRFFDTAESYQDGRSEQWLGAALHDVRASVFVASKTFASDLRRADSARCHLEGSLRRLATDYLDLWQLHAVRSVADVDRAFGPGGAVEYLLEAQQRGLVRFIGVTGHATPVAHLRALEHWDRGLRFDVMQLPLNPLDVHQRSFQRQVLPGIVARGIGVIAMKTSADGALLRTGLSIADCLHYVWSLPVSVAVVGMERPELVRHNAALARRHAQWDARRMAGLEARVAPPARLGLEWYKGE
jgi:aryl-alcohol dehydrogenase-like predicted oxidoreductase